MHDVELQEVEVRICGAVQHACRALIAMEDLRSSQDPGLRAAYAEVHDLIGDLGALSVQVASMAMEHAGKAPGGEVRRTAGGGD